MKLLIFSPAAANSTRGNRITAMRWAKILGELRHEATIVDPHEFVQANLAKYDLLIALHARHSAGAIKEFKRVSPDKPILVALTGTDLHGDLPSESEHAATVIQSLQIADRIILIEPEGRKRLPSDLQKKTVVIFQSATPVNEPVEKSKSDFVVTVIGHLRPVKDPFLTAEATKLLPSESKIKVYHYGETLTDEMKTNAERETVENLRYEWRGPVSHEEAQEKLAASHVTVLSSKFEGAPSVISEAVVNCVPVLATRIDATIGILGEQYPGLFPVGDAQRLAELLTRTEADADFYALLKTALEMIGDRFGPKIELDAWRNLLASAVTKPG